MALVDSHCHLFDMRNYALPEDIIPVVVGYSHGSNMKTVENAKGKYPFVLGIAPQTVVKEGTAKLAEWIEFIKKHRPNAIGEVGLDYKWARNKDDVENQKSVFEKMMALADELDVPLVIHSRNNPNDNGVPKNAIEDILGMVKGKGFVMHFFSGDEKQAARAVSMGGYISFTEMRSKERRKVINTVPLDKILVESDAPYVGRTPESIREAIAYIAEVKDMELHAAGTQTAQNAAKFFGFRL